MKREVKFLGVDPLALTKGAVQPMIAESWRFGFQEGIGMLLFGAMDDGPLVAQEAVRQLVSQALDTDAAGVPHALIGDTALRLQKGRRPPGTETTKQLADKAGVSHDFFNKCRGIWGTENYGQDAALAEVISTVLAEARPRDFAFAAVTVADAPEAALLREIREHAEQTRHLVNRVQTFVEDRGREPLPEGHAPHSQVTAPGRWAALGQTELQSGFMKLVRAIEQPAGF